MNLAGLESDMYRRLGFPVAPATEVTTRFRAYLNQTQREILSQKGLESLRRLLVVATSTASNNAIFLPFSAVRILTVVDRTNQITLEPIALDDRRLRDPGATATGTPYAFAVLRLAGAVVAAGGASVVSDSASDGATKTVFIEYVTQPGIYGTATAVLNGVTPVNLSTAVPATGTVTKFYLALGAGGATSAVGTITLFSAVAGGGTVVGTIQPGKAYARHTGLSLFPTPSEAITYHCDIVVHIEEMAVAGDEPYLPEDFHWLLTSGALMKEFQRLEKTTLYAEERAVFKDGLANLKLFVARATHGSEAGGWPRRWSMLGSWFPHGS